MPSDSQRQRGVDVLRLLGDFGARFDVEARLGVGAHGAVYRVFDRQRGARVALKVPHEHDAHALLRLKDEFRSLASISHPNVVAFHELFIRENSFFFTMQFVRGVDVLTHTARTPESSRDVLVGLALGLETLHAHGVVHRDIKPSNAWVDTQGVPVLLDFGLALAGPLRTPSRALAGTPTYFAPELLDGHAPSLSSDVYALGVLAFEMLTRRRPFDRETEQDARLPRAPRVRELVPSADPTLAELVDAMLDPEPAQRPTAAQIRARLDQRDRGALRISMPHAPVALRDRDALARSLEDDISGARNGKPIVRFVHGPAGIGKSMFVQRALASARARDANLLVLRGRCSEHESVPFATIDAIVDQLARHLAQTGDSLRAALDVVEIARLEEAFPVFSSVRGALDSEVPPRELISDPRERLRRVGEALASVLSKVATHGTVALVIDDAHWSEEDGARLLAEAMRGLGAARVALIVAHRDEEEPSASLAHLLSLDADLDVARITVPPLSETDAETLALALGAPRDRHARLLRESAGSPFLLETLALGGLDAREGQGDADALARSAVARRLEALPTGARALFETICVAGHPVPLDVAVRAAGLFGDVASARTLDAARLVRSHPLEDRRAQLEAYHDRLRALTMEALSVDRKRVIHAALAEALERSSSADPMWICIHLQGAGEMERAASYAEAGARRASQTLAFARAAELFRFAIAHHTDAYGRAEPRRALQVCLGDALANAGRGHEASRAYLDACEGERDVDRHLDLRRRAAEQALRSGFFAEGTELLNAVLREAGAPVRERPSRAIVGLLRNRLWLRRHGLGATVDAVHDPGEVRRIDACFSGAAGLSVVDSVRSADLMTEALRRSLTIGDQRRRAAALGWYTAFLANGGGPAESATRAVLEEARVAVANDGDAYARGCFEAASSLVEFHLGHLSLAEAACRRAEAVFANETSGTTKELSTVHTFLLASLALLGRLGELATRVEELVRISEARGERYALTNYRQGLMILRHLAKDEPLRAHRDLDLALTNFGAQGFVVQHFFDLWGRTITELYEGHPEAARARFVAMRGRVLRSLLIRTQWTRGHVLALEATTSLACIASRPLGDLKARAWLAWTKLVIDQLAREQRPWTHALARVLKACWWAASGERERAHAALREVIVDLDRAELGLYANAARAHLAAVDAEAAIACDLWAIREGVVNPARFAQALLPGFAATRESV